MDWKDIIKKMKKSNPYPEDIFLPVSDEKFRDAMNCLRHDGFSTEGIMGQWGREVWGFAVAWLKDYLSYFDEEVKERQK